MKRGTGLRHKSMIIVAVICIVLFTAPMMVAPMQVFAAEETGTYVVRTTQRCSIWSAPATTEENRIKYVDEGYQITVYPEVIQSELGDGKTFYRTIKGAYVLCGYVAVEAQSDVGAEAVTYGLVQTDNGVMWKQEDGTWAVDCWLTALGRLWHVDENGYIQLGMSEIDGKSYYLYLEGKLARGWTQIEDSLYFFHYDGTLAVNTVVDGLYLGTDGKAVSENGELIPQENELRETVDTILASIIMPGMTEEEKLAACYWYMADNHTYKRDPEIPNGDWTSGYALEILTTGEGNCYRFAAAFAYLLEEMGFETKVITGQVGSSRGGMTPHSWTEVKIGSEWYVFDTELQYANKDKDYYWKTYETYPIRPVEKQQEWFIHFRHGEN